ncbi:helix-turn-helix domain-containing protein [Paenibacillus dendritiformis]|uniref:helix-turn-helix domain-containing protein n=1 Tax=Paenibacillus TaxID=44249 RepID=UPI0011634A6E|nr:helix-turn-helix transcriptional regulator [Paenibacillus thiaminolyticus]NGP60024.1 helix-turn-helix transcriptional regulator [Paenibacillus thiaminolyticus]NGP60098.1 helix-turn-helix transcriptional regulator [Paenibacillus thiaminolyticus]NGP60137.1 helix-turn-helix transcriptional regulator [Paenibacillus thiaminolyticus]
MSFSEQVKEHMNEQGIRPTQLAQMICYSTPHVYDLFSGKRRWNETTMKKACDVLGLEMKIVKKKVEK